MHENKLFKTEDNKSTTFPHVLFAVTSAELYTYFDFQRQWFAIKHMITQVNNNNNNNNNNNYINHKTRRM